MSELYTEEMLPIQCGMMSLVGTSDTRPTSWGNYFSLSAGPRVVNFWWENLESANEAFNLEGKVKIRRYKNQSGDWCLIDDERIPNDWYYNKLCFTGSRAPSIEILKDMYAYLGDPSNELERYVDPEIYWEKRGATYNAETGIICQTIGK